VAVLSDNSPEKNSNSLFDHTGEGVVIDIGTGDGRFVLAAARANPKKFFIGIDANAQALEKISTKATRKQSKGGAPNTLFVYAAVEQLPEDLDTTADEIHIHFPWGSLLKAVATGDEKVLRGLRRIAAPECLLEIVIGIDPERDRTETDRLGIGPLTSEYFHSVLLRKYHAAGFEITEYGDVPRSEWACLESSWARRLQSNPDRQVLYLIARSI
jgi:ubiquinone/menaquinone biosynthesis C-methylase UbiE